jgi:dihydroflavonol-4-reductase
VRYFVTGATGFIGSHLIPKLIERGHSVTSLVRSPVRADALKSLGATLVQGDVTDRASLHTMQGADGVFHLAGIYEMGHRYHAGMHAVNVDGARNVFETAVELGVPKIVHASTLAIFGNTHGRVPDEAYRIGKQALASEYERTKWEAHYDVALPLIERGAPIVIVQPGVVTGLGDTSPASLTIDAYVRRLPVMLGAKSGVTWAHVDDIADGFILAMEKGRIGESYILAGPAMTYQEAMRMWQRLTGVPAPKIWLPDSVAGAAAGLIGLLERAFNLKLSYSSEALATLDHYTFYASAEKAHRELGWQPRPVEQVFKEVLDYTLSQRQRR